MPRACNKDAQPVTYPLSLDSKNDAAGPLWTRKNGILHLNVPAIEKIRFAFTDMPLFGFGLICDLLFAMTHIAACNCTIVLIFRIDFPNAK